MAAALHYQEVTPQLEGWTPLGMVLHDRDKLKGRKRGREGGKEGRWPLREKWERRVEMTL